MTSDHNEKVNTDMETASKAQSEILRMVRDMESSLFTFREDMNVLAWACDQLWHAEFGRVENNEKLSRMPIAVIRLAAIASEQLHRKSEEFFPAERYRYPADGLAWFEAMADKAAKGS